MELTCPIILAFIKGIGQAAPTRVLCEDFLLLGRSQAVFKFKLVQEVDSSHIALKLFLRTAHTEIIVGNAVVVFLTIGNFGVRVIHGKFSFRLFGFNHFGHHQAVLSLVFCDFLVANRHKIIEVKSRKLVIVQSFQSFILNNFDKVITKIFFNLSLYQVHVDLHEKLLILRGRVRYGDFGKVIKYRIIVTVCPTKEISEIFLGAFKLVNLQDNLCTWSAFTLRTNSYDVCAVLLGKLDNGVESFIVDANTRNGIKIFVKSNRIIQKKLIELPTAPLIA